MTDMENFKNEILESSKERFNIFFTFELPSDAKFTVQWQGEDIKGFLSICQSLNINLLYFFEGRMVDDYPEHGSEIAMVQLGFVYNGVLHIFVKEAEWFVKDTTPKTPVEQNSIASQSLGDLVSEMVKFIQEQYQDLPDEEYRLESYLRDAQRRFWLEKGLDRIRDRETAIKVEKVQAEVLAYFVKLRKEEIQRKVRAVLDKPLESLADEMFEMVSRELEGVTDKEGQFRQIFWMVKRPFWTQKGVERTSEPAVEIKKQKVEHEVENRFLASIRERSRQKEAGILPALIEECVTWCNEHNLTRLTKTNIPVFLREKNVHLSATGTESLYLEVNQKLSERTSYGHRQTQK